LLPHFFMILGTHFKNDRQTKEILGAERVFPLPAYTLNSAMMFFGYIFHFKNDRQTKQTLKGIRGSFPYGKLFNLDIRELSAVGRNNEPQFYYLVVGVIAATTTSTTSNTKTIYADTENNDTFNKTTRRLTCFKNIRHWSARLDSKQQWAGLGSPSSRSSESVLEYHLLSLSFNAKGVEKKLYG
jgi:hypothetical protein